MAKEDSILHEPLLARTEKGEEEDGLKYLEFVQVAAFHALVFAARVYSYAKENSGPLKPSVVTVEGTVKNVVGPVLDKYRGVPVEVLKFVDRKVDESVNKVQSRVPPALKQVSAQAIDTARGAPAAARAVITEVKDSGVVEKASGFAKTMYTKYEPAAKDLRNKYEPVAEQYAASAWQSLSQLPVFPKVAHAVAPAARYCSEKYNQTVQHATERGSSLASHLPLMPTEKIAEVLLRS